MIEINGVQYQENDKNIFLDYIDKKWKLSKGILTDSIYIGINKESSSGSNVSIDFRLGKFTATGENYEILSILHDDTTRSKKICVNGDIYTMLDVSETELNSMNFIIGNVNTSMFFHKSQIHIYDKMPPYRKFNNAISENSLEQSVQIGKISKEDKKKKLISAGVISPTYVEFENHKYTWGIEIETISGRLEAEDVKDLNFSAVHDGSLRGPEGEDPLGGEYVTGVLTGDTGLAQLYKICKLLQSKCKIDKRCGKIGCHLIQ